MIKRTVSVISVQFLHGAEKIRKYNCNSSSLSLAILWTSMENFKLDKNGKFYIYLSTTQHTARGSSGLEQIYVLIMYSFLPTLNLTAAV